MSEHAVPTLTLTLFGGFEARTSTGGLLSFRTAKAQALVAYLALEADTHHARSKLATLLWGNAGEARARDSLRHALGDIRRTLACLSRSPLTLTRSAVAFNCESIDVDVHRFNQMVEAGSVAALRSAIDLYRGDLLDGILLEEESFECWIVQQRETLRARLIRALENNLAAQLDTGRSQQAVEAAQRILRFDRAHEVAHRALMRLHHEQGQRAAALRQYRSCVASLETEVGAPPDRQTRALHDAILRAERQPEAGQPAGANRELRGTALETRENARPALQRSDALLVGRAVEIAVLRSAIGAASLGSGGCVFVTGEAGIGKTRLVCEAVSVAPGDTRVLQARGYENERTHALGVWADALRSAHARELRGVASRLDDEWMRELAGLVPELGCAKHARAAHANERYLFDAVLHLVSGLGEDGPAIVVLEDLHWADDASLRLLAFVARRIASSHVLLLATIRDEETEGSDVRGIVDALVSASLASVIEVTPLSRAHTLELLDRMSGRETFRRPTEQQRARIWQVSRGIPFVVVEIVRAMREGTSLDVFAAGSVPDSIRRVVGCRVRALREGARAVLAVAAVIGCEFEFPLMVQAAELAAPELVSALEELVRRKMLQSTGDRLGFTHAWIREWMYESLLAPRRELLHLRVALAYEATTSSGEQSVPATLAYHYAQAKAWVEAAASARLAGELALRRYAYSEAATLFASARAALEQLPQDARVTHELVEVLVKLHRALVPTGLATPIVTNLREAVALSDHANDSAQRANVLLCVSEYARWTGDYSRAIDSGERGLSAAIEIGHTALAAEARFHLGLARFWKGHYRTAISSLRQSAIDAGVSSDVHRSGGVLYASIGAPEYLALALASIGRFASARKIADDALGVAQTIEDPLRQVAAARALGFVLAEQGDFETAIPLLERTLARCERDRLELLYSLIAGTLGYAYAISGRARHGATLIEKAIAQRETLRGLYHGSYGAYLLSRIAEACLLGGRIDAAMAYAQRVADFARRYDNRVDEAWSLRLSGDLAVHGGGSDVDAAETLYMQSRAIAARQGMIPFVAHCDLRVAGLAALGLDNDRSGAARERARAAYARLGMLHWLARTEQPHARGSNSV